MRNLRTMLMALALLLTLVPTGTPASAAEQQCFEQTNQCIEGRFLEYWRQNGGLQVFGYPITAAREEFNRDTGKYVLTQSFERNRFELHPQNARPYDVLLGRLGDDVLLAKGIRWANEPTATGPQTGCLWFATTKHNVCDQEASAGFKRYWEGYGLEFDGQSGISYSESLALFGLPLTEPRVETNSSGDAVLTQWFERARFEYHPNKEAQYRVLLGLVGNEAQPPFVFPSQPALSGLLYLTSSAYLYSVDMKTGAARKFIDVGDAIVSPNGKLVVMYAKCSTGERIGLCLLDLTTNTYRQLNDDRFAILHGWSPDGTRIAYSSSTEGRRGLYVLRIDGGGEIKVAEPSGEYGVMDVVWSPDGSKLAYRTYSNELYVVNADGTGTRKIADRGWTPSWSPSQTIAFASDMHGQTDVYTVAPDGTNLTRRTTVGADRPLWSPDGTKLAYLTARLPEGGSSIAPPRSLLVVEPAQGGQAVPVLSAATAGEAYAFSVYLWSPDSAALIGTVGCPKFCRNFVLGGWANGSGSFAFFEGSVTLKAWR